MMLESPSDSRPIRLEAITGIRLQAAWPSMHICQWSRESMLPSWGSEPIAVG
ncbi:hypothetical protein D3C86_2153100 [compost metagenome]